MRDIENVRFQAEHAIANNGGFTMDANGATYNPASGFAVALEGFETIGEGSTLTLDRFLTEAWPNAKRTGHRPLYIGGWSENGRVVLDAVVIVATKREAERLAIQNRQRAFYSFAIQEAIDTPKA